MGVIKFDRIILHGMHTKKVRVCALSQNTCKMSVLGSEWNSKLLKGKYKCYVR